MEEKIKEKTKEKTQEAKETTKENRLMKTVEDSRTEKNGRSIDDGAGSSDHAPALKCRRQIVWRNADAVGG